MNILNMHHLIKLKTYLDDMNEERITNHHISMSVTFDVLREIPRVLSAHVHRYQ